MLYLEASAKTRAGIRQAFEEVRAAWTRLSVVIVIVIVVMVPLLHTHQRRCGRRLRRCDPAGVKRRLRPGLLYY
jgi:hypothetical protein